MIFFIAVCMLVLVLPASLFAQSPAPFTFLALGDGGEPGNTVGQNAIAMNKIVGQLERDHQPVDLLVFLGDNFYPIGLNRTEEVRRELIDEVLGPFRSIMLKLGRRNVRAIAGNHDYYCRIINGIPMNTCGTGNQYEDSIDLWTYHYHFPNSLRHAVASGSRDSVDVIFFDSAFLLTRDQAQWRPVLDSLERLLRRSAAAPGVQWRVLWHIIPRIPSATTEAGDAGCRTKTVLGISATVLKKAMIHSAISSSFFPHRITAPHSIGHIPTR
jgi:hypothetical protein